MNLEQIVKETVAKIVAEKTLTAAEEKKREEIVKAMKKDFKGPEGAMYAIATNKAKKLAEVANKIYITHKGPSDDPNSNYMQYDLTFNGDEINAEEYAKGWKVIRYDDWEDEWKDVRNPKKQEIINFINAYNEKNSDNINEDDLNQDHEVSMAQRSLDSIIRAAMELKAKIGDQEIDIPAWIQDHITNSENYIDQASQGYHEYHNSGEHGEMDETRDPNSESDVPYYAVFDVHSKQPHYIIAKSASEMLSRLNGYIRAKAETNPEYKFSYGMEDLQDDYYNGKLMPHVISDDFASVTKNAEEFKKDLSYYPNAVEYKGLNEDDSTLDDEDIIEKITGDKVEVRFDDDDDFTQYYSVINDNIFYTMEVEKVNNVPVIIKHDTKTNQKTPIRFTYDRNKKEYVKLAEELDEWTIRRMQHYAGIK